MRRAAPLLLLSLLAAACTSGQTSVSPSAAPGLEAEIVATDLQVGKDQRFPLGILDRNTPVNDAVVRVRAFYLANNATQPKGESDAPFKGDGLGGRGVYVARLNLDVAGNWGVEVTAQRPNGEHAVKRLAFQVLANPIVPAVGQPAPRSHNLTVKDVSDVSTIDTGNPPNDMHQVSIADAIAQRRPTLVIFASPAFCTSRICGPQVQVVQSLEPAYRDRLTFIHVEIWRDYKPDPTKKQFAQTVVDWRIQTEPWVFLIDPQGVIRSRFEGPASADELKAGIDRLLASP